MIIKIETNRWIRKLMSDIPEIIPPPSLWDYFDSYANFSQDLLGRTSQKHNISISSFSVNTLQRTSLVVVDEYGNLSDEDCLKFKFVLRVGFGPYPNSQNSRGTLWKQPRNTLLVPLGVPSHMPQSDDLLSSFSSRTTKERHFIASFAGRSQNANREHALKGMLELQSLSKKPSSHQLSSLFIHHTGWIYWSEGMKKMLSYQTYFNALMDSVLAPSPPGNRSPDCYRTYEALEAGAIPIVDTDYYRVLFGAPFIQVNHFSWNLTAAIHDLVVNYRQRHPTQPPSTLSSTLSDSFGVDEIHLALEEKRISVLKWWEEAKQRSVRQVSAHVRFIISSDDNNNIDYNEDYVDNNDDDGNDAKSIDKCSRTMINDEAIEEILSQIINCDSSLVPLDGVVLGGAPVSVIGGMTKALPETPRFHLVGPWFQQQIVETKHVHHRASGREEDQNTSAHLNQHSHIQVMGDRRWDQLMTTLRLNHAIKNVNLNLKPNRVRYTYIPPNIQSDHFNHFNQLNGNVDFYYKSKIWIQDEKDMIHNNSQKTFPHFSLSNHQTVLPQSLGTEMFKTQSLSFIYLHLTPNGEIWYHGKHRQYDDLNIITEEEVNGNYDKNETGQKKQEELQDRIKFQKERKSLPYGRNGFRVSLDAWWPKLAPGGLLCGSNYVMPIDSINEITHDKDTIDSGDNILKSIGQEFDVSGVLTRWLLKHKNEVKVRHFQHDLSGLNHHEVTQGRLHIAKGFDRTKHFGSSWWIQKSNH